MCRRVARRAARSRQGVRRSTRSQILNAKDIKASEIEDKLATQATTRFLFLFQGIAYDYSVYDETVLQRDMARVERFYRSKGFLDAHARVARVEQVSPDHVRVEIVVDEGPPTMNRDVRFVGLEGLPKDVADAAAQRSTGDARGAASASTRRPSRTPRGP